ncbi:MAG: GNAT family N-acetyltransferase [Roseovarius sp.]
MPSVILAPLPRDAVGRVAHLNLPAHQSEFVAPIAEMVDEPDTLQDFHLALQADDPVGFFKIDRDYARRITRLPPAAHGFRGLLIGGQYQGQGLGRAMLMALPGYIRQQYGVSTLWLSVDESNTSAISLYGACGWCKDADPHRGRIGLEQVMRLDI